MEIERRSYLLSELDGTINARSGVMAAAISSEFPVERPGGQEVLSHEPNAIDLSRAPLPLIASHDHQMLNIGLVENLKIVRKKLKGVIRFGDRAEARETWRDVKNGILKYLSIGYEVIQTESSKGGYLVTKWRPLEVSIVSVPADPSVGFNRALNTKGNYKMDFTKEHMQKLLVDMQVADGAELSRIGSEYDQIATVVNPDAPLVRDSGAAAVVRWSKVSADAVDRQHIDTRQEDTEGPQRRVFKSLGDQVRAVIAAGTPGGQTDPRLYMRAITGTGTTIPSDGGFLIEPTYSNKILENVWSGSEVLKQITKYSLGGNSNSLKVPGFDESSRATGSRWGGIRGYWTAEAAQFQSSTPKFRMIELNLNKIVCLCYATDELLEDSTAIESYINKAFAGEIAFMVQNAIINGSGAGQPLGILNAGCMVSVAKEAGQAGSTIVWENILKMWSRLLASSRPNSIWVINQDCENQLNQMSIAVGTGGVPVYMPAGGASGQPYNTLFGRPVVPIEQCPSLGTTGDIMLCDFSGGYIGIDKKARFDSSIHLRFDYGEQILRATYRFDGQPVLSSPVTPFSAGDTLSHFIKLDTRA